MAFSSLCLPNAGETEREREGDAEIAKCSYRISMIMYGLELILGFLQLEELFLKFPNQPERELQLFAANSHVVCLI